MASSEFADEKEESKGPFSITSKVSHLKWERQATK